MSINTEYGKNQTPETENCCQAFFLELSDTLIPDPKDTVDLILSILPKYFSWISLEYDY